jgi:hypothetical protein
MTRLNYAILLTSNLSTVKEYHHLKFSIFSFNVLSIILVVKRLILYLLVPRSLTTCQDIIYQSYDSQRYYCTLLLAHYDIT